jgi:hypothetical protein
MNGIGIVGSGPRALSIAIYAQHLGKKVTLIDPQPLSAWKTPKILPDLEMRSPITFDLVTFLGEDFSAWRLDKFLGTPYTYTSQQEAEACPCFLNRKEFLSYLEHVLGRLVSRGASLITQGAIAVGRNWVRLADKSLLEFDAVVIANGSNSIGKVPTWISKTQHYEKLISTEEVVNKQPQDSLYVVVGSGQAAGEYVSYIAQANRVFWLTNKDYRIDQYPSPTYKEWGPKSALGSYYREFHGDSSLQEQYLKGVKTWQPSITPSLHKELEERSDSITEIRVESVREVNQIMDDADQILICTGFKSSLKATPMLNAIQALPSDPNFPLLLSGFRSTSGLYFTGQLALRYDGPRQASVISAGLTAKEILEDIYELH